MEDSLDFRFLSLLIPLFFLFLVNFSPYSALHFYLFRTPGKEWPFSSNGQCILQGCQSRMAAVWLHPVSLTRKFCKEICEVFIIFSLCSSSFTEHQQDVRHHEEQGVKHPSAWFLSSRSLLRGGRVKWVQEQIQYAVVSPAGNSSSLMLPLPLQISHLPVKPKHILLVCSLVFLEVVSLKQSYLSDFLGTSNSFPKFVWLATF